MHPLNCLFLPLLFPILTLSAAQTSDHQTAGLSTKWTNSPSLNLHDPPSDGSQVRAILRRGTIMGPSFACGFVCTGASTDFLFSIFIVFNRSFSDLMASTDVVWSANRDSPVQENATLQLSEDGDLVLRDADGSAVWSTNTSGRSVVGMRVTDIGRLELFDSSNSSVWSSIDHPTDSWVLVHSPGQRPKALVSVILGLPVGYIFLASLVIGSIACARRNMGTEFEEDDQFGMVHGINPARFSLEELKIATENFCRKLGGGGFGSVFEGMLGDGTRVAVKRSDGVGHGNKEFLAEVETIGSIHHINLVRLVGFCAEKSWRLLVYEYMCNGSLDKWIFYHGQDHALNWLTRRRIITDIAKGLAYLHEDCRQKIVHLDIKPQNILLDAEFNAKVSDFGLSKLIDRDQASVMTRLRGTPGYLAPEWLTSVITEKADVYSFGVVVMEIVCGRKNLDYTQPEERIHLLNMLQVKVEEERLSYLVDRRSSDMQQHIEECVEMMKLSMWCLQSDSGKRPPMSVVLKVLEGSMTADSDIDYRFSFPAPSAPCNANNGSSASQSATLLSGPR